MSIPRTGIGDSDVLVVSPKAACRMLSCSITRLYELLNSRQLQSYRDGKSRRILVASINSYISRQIADEDSKERKRWTDQANKARLEIKDARNVIRTVPAQERRR